MKLNEVVQREDENAASFWYGMIYDRTVKMTEDDMVKAIEASAALIADLYHMGYKPTEKVQWTAIYRWPWAIEYIEDRLSISDDMKEYVLTTDDTVLDADEKDYDSLVKYLYPNNALMQRKWIRYGVRKRLENETE